MEDDAIAELHDDLRIIAAAANALEILEEANMLADAGHDARAFSLSVLGAEELSKAWAALVAETFPGDQEVGRALRAILRGLIG